MKAINVKFNLISWLNECLRCLIDHAMLIETNLQSKIVIFNKSLTTRKSRNHSRAKKRLFDCNTYNSFSTMLLLSLELVQTPLKKITLYITKTVTVSDILNEIKTKKN